MHYYSRYSSPRNLKHKYIIFINEDSRVLCWHISCISTEMRGSWVYTCAVMMFESASFNMYCDLAYHYRYVFNCFSACYMMYLLRLGIRI